VAALKRSVRVAMSLGCGEIQQSGDDGQTSFRQTAPTLWIETTGTAVVAVGTLSIAVPAAIAA
jgi:hypothetical protein